MDTGSRYLCGVLVFQVGSCLSLFGITSCPAFLLMFSLADLYHPQAQHPTQNLLWLLTL